LEKKRSLPGVDGQSAAWVQAVARSNARVKI
jgi:hypothetical protein